MRRANVLVSLVSLAAAWGQPVAQPDYSGTWRQQSDSAVQFVVEEKDDSIHVKEWRGTVVTADYTCNTLGKECKVKSGGHTTTVSFWFNGPKLVELETRGSTVTRRRFELADSGKTLNIELSPIVPEGKSEILAFARQPQ